MRFACVLIQHLPVNVERLLLPALRQPVLVLLRAWDERVVDASPQAIAAGVRPGDTRHRVEQVCPQAAILPAREALYQARHEALTTALKQFADALESGELGECLIEVGALARAFASEEALALQIAAQVEQAVGLAPVVGIASNKFTAMQAARQATGGRVCIVQAGQEGKFLAPLPVTVLPDLPAELLRRLHLLGITTLQELAQLPRQAVTRQFGPEATVFHDLARGVDARPLNPQSPPPLVSRLMSLPEPVSDRQSMLAALDHLVGQLACQLEQAGFQATALSLTITTSGGQEYLEGISVRPPSADVGLLGRLAARLLGKLPITADVTSLALTAYPLREWHAGAHQLVLLDTPAAERDRPLSVRLSRLWETVRLLRQRFGATAIRLASTLGPLVPIPIQVQVQAEGRPAWLSWNGRLCKVVRVYEHWRVCSRWWEQPVRRDYYQVETDHQMVFTLFQDERGQWFLDRQGG